MDDDRIAAGFVLLDLMRDGRPDLSGYGDRPRMHPAWQDRDLPSPAGDRPRRRVALAPQARDAQAIRRAG